MSLYSLNINSNFRCDDGFYGKSCVPQDKLRNKIIKKFESAEELVKGNFDISGGSITSADEACGPVGSGSSLYFYQVSNILEISSIKFIENCGNLNFLICIIACSRFQNIELYFL